MSSVLIKELNDGNSYCTLCCIQIKTKALTAHVNGRKHRDAILNLKQQITAKQAKEQELAIKRKHTETQSSSDVKRFKEERSDSEDESDSDEQAVQASEYQPKTPWQIEARERQNHERLAVVPPTTNVIEGLPRGFFDDEKLNSRVRDTIEKQKQMDDELDKFFKEVAEIETQKEEEQEELAQSSAIQKDLELIDEQMERWKAVNELEMKKEELVNTVSIKFDQEPNFDSVDPDSDLDAEVDDFDFEKINWRTKFI